MFILKESETIFPVPKVEVIEEGIKLYNLPRPISVNEYLPRHFPTKNKKKFLKDFQDWTLQVDHPSKFLNKFCESTEDLRELKEGISPLLINVNYYWFTKLFVKGKSGYYVKCFDSSNFIKCMEDRVSDWLGIDDKYFKNFSFITGHTSVKADEYFNMLIQRPSSYC